MPRFDCPECLCQRFRLGVQFDGHRHSFYIRCFDCGYTMNFFPVPLCFELDESDKVVLADTDSLR